MTALVQKPAPEFKATAMVQGDFKELSLGDYKGKHLVLFFYPLDFTFVCPTELLAFDQKLEEFQKMGCEVVGCSIDSQFSHLAWWKTPRNEGGIENIRYPLLADVSRRVCRDYGVLNDDGVALRGLFVIDPKGTVRHALVNDLGIGRSVEEALRVVQAIQFTDKHGEVCPANWNPGADTMKPDPEGSKTYFKKAN